MATQKDYKAIAGIIRQEYARFDNTGENDYEGQHAIRCVTVNIANYFASRNEWFNRNTFLDACGIEE